MIDRRENIMHAGNSIEDLEDKIAETNRGPVFQVGDIKEIDGYRWRITGLQKNRMHLKLVGPVKKSEE